MYGGGDTCGLAVDPSYSDENWCAFLQRFAESVQHVTGQVVDVRLASDTDHSLLQEEIDHLRTTVDKLSDEVRLSAATSSCKRLTSAVLCAQRSQLRNELDQQVAELNTLKSVPSVPASIGRGAGRGNPEVRCLLSKGIIAWLKLPQSTQNFHGLVQRLVQKEKQVLQLQNELDRVKAQNPTETRENVSAYSMGRKSY